MLESLLRPGLSRAADFWSPLAVRMHDRRIVLCFHSVKAPDDSTRGYIARRSRMGLESFDMLVRWLKSWASIVSLQDLMDDTGTGWRVALTFDDGYLDNLRSALPLLESYKAPMTWFVCTRFVLQPNVLPWWDLIDYAETHVRAHLTFSYANESFDYDLKKPGERNRLRREQRSHFYKTGVRERGRHQKILATAVRDATGRHLPVNGFARPDEVAQATDSPWITIGAHTHTHQNLGACSADIVSRELVQGRTLLEEWTGQAIRWFAYPFGDPSAWTPQTTRLVEEHGFEGAFTLEPDHVGRAPHPQAVPRIAVDPNWEISDVKARIFGTDLFRWARTAKAYAK